MRALERFDDATILCIAETLADTSDPPGNSRKIEGRGDEVSAADTPREKKAETRRKDPARWWGAQKVNPCLRCVEVVSHRLVVKITFSPLCETCEGALYVNATFQVASIRIDYRSHSFISLLKLVCPAIQVLDRYIIKVLFVTPPLTQIRSSQRVLTSS